MTYSEDGQTVYLAIHEFRSMLEYSMSIPTGKNEGKRWKRNNNVHWPRLRKDWIMGEYIKSDRQDVLNIRWTRIVIRPTRAEWEALDKLPMISVSSTLSQNLQSSTL